MNKCVAIATLMMIVTGLAPAETFRKTKMMDGNREVAVELGLDREGRVLMVSGSTAPISVPYASIDKLSYEEAARHRVKEGAIVMLASLGAGGIVMLTKSKKHWLYVDYKDDDGSAKNLTLKLDKSEYKTVLSTLQEQTGKEVQTLRQ